MGTPKSPESQDPPVAKPEDPIDLTESVAGEEDPGADIDVVGTPAQTAKPAPAAGKDKPRGN